MFTAGSSSSNLSSLSNLIHVVTEVSSSSHLADQQFAVRNFSQLTV